MTPRLRVWLIVALAALAAAGATVGATLATRTGTHRVQAPAKPPAPPPLVLDLGVRTDPEARALRRAAALYAGGKRSRAAEIFRRRRSLEAQVGAALADWPAGRGRLQALARANPRSALAQLYLGIVLFEGGKTAPAQTAWRRAERLQPDTAYAIAAGDLLHRDLPIPGLPQFVLSFPPPPELRRLSPPRQLVFLAARARRGGFRAKLLYGVALQRLQRPVSAERQFAAAAALAPRDAEAQAAAAVGLFRKDDPARAFSRLGPLVRRFPHAQTVRFHLGLLLLWLGQVDQAKRQFRLALADGPSTSLGAEAKQFLVRLENVRTRRRKR